MASVSTCKWSVPYGKNFTGAFQLPDERKIIIQRYILMLVAVKFRSIEFLRNSHYFCTQNEAECVGDGQVVYKIKKPAVGTCIGIPDRVVFLM